MIRGEAGSSDVFVHFLSQKLTDRISQLFSEEWITGEGKMENLLLYELPREVSLAGGGMRVRCSLLFSSGAVFLSRADTDLARSDLLLSFTDLLLLRAEA